jgi:hypothetical protein
MRAFAPPALGNGGPNRLDDRREVEGGLGGQAKVIDRMAQHVHLS